MPGCLTSPFSDEAVTCTDERPHRPLMSAAEQQLWQRWRDLADEQARAQLLEHYLPYARTVAAIYYARRNRDNVCFDDYHQCAALALIESLNRYDPSRGAQFKTFAARRMHGAILDGIEQDSEQARQLSVLRRLRAERCAALDAMASVRASTESHHDTDTDDPSPPPSHTDSIDPRISDDAAHPPAHHIDDLFRRLAEVGIGLALGILLEDTGLIENTAQAPVTEHPYFQSTQLKQLRTRLQQALRGLNAQESRVIRGHYFQQQRFDDIALCMGLSKGRISQLHHQALRRLRQRLGTHSARELLA